MLPKLSHFTISIHYNHGNLMGIAAQKRCYLIIDTLTFGLIYLLAIPIFITHLSYSQSRVAADKKAL